ncbi:hypothetical protein Tco_1244616 [Tanacetum coccineum]
MLADSRLDTSPIGEAFSRGGHIKEEKLTGCLNDLNVEGFVLGVTPDSGIGALDDRGVLVAFARKMIDENIRTQKVLDLEDRRREKRRKKEWNPDIGTSVEYQKPLLAFLDVSALDKPHFKLENCIDDGVTTSLQHRQTHYHMLIFKL